MASHHFTTSAGAQWSDVEIRILHRLRADGKQFDAISLQIPGRTGNACSTKYSLLHPHSNSCGRRYCTQPVHRHYRKAPENIYGTYETVHTISTLALCQLQLLSQNEILTVAERASRGGRKKTTDIAHGYDLYCDACEVFPECDIGRFFVDSS